MPSRNETAPYANSQLYREAMGYFQRGEWEVGLRNLKRVIDEYPLELELQQIRQQMELRARLEVDEQVDQKTKRQRTIVWTSARVLLGLVLLAGFGYLLTLSAGWMAEIIKDTSEEAFGAAKALESQMKLRDAQNLYSLGRAEEAMVLVDELLAEDFETATVTGLRENILVLLDTDEEYQAAKRVYLIGNYAAALPLFQEINQRKPAYRDVPELIDEIQQNIYYENILTNADAAFHSGNWQQAITLYTELNSINVNYRTSYVQEQLYQSLVKSAEAIMANPTGTMADLDAVDKLFRRALAYKPQDPQVKVKQTEIRRGIEERLFWTFVNEANELLSEQTDSLNILEEIEKLYDQALKVRPDSEEVSVQRNLARKYLKAIDDFGYGRWTQVINALEEVCAVDLGYAKGTARHTLYEAYLKRGDNGLAGALYESALNDYRRAAELAAEDKGVGLKVFEAQTRLANIQGLLGDYATAVQIYRAAIEDTGFSARVQSENSVLAARLAEAERFAVAGNHQNAYRLYREVVSGSERVYRTVTHVVEKGEYLSGIAAHYRSTASAIADLNKIENPNRIYAGQELLIPIFPTP